MKKIRKLLVAAAIAAGYSLSSLAADGDAYATQPVKLVVTNPPGSVPDALGRTIADGLQQARGVPVLVDTRAGANGVIGAEAVVRAAPDGTTLLLAADSLMSVLPHLQEKMPFNTLTDLKPIAYVADASVVLVTTPQQNMNTLRDFVAQAKARPGALSYGSFGMGSSHHRAMLRLQQMTGIQVTHIPYGSKSPIPDLLGGQIPIMWSGLSGALPLIQSGKVVPLAVSSAKRSPNLPEVPTVAELGYPGFAVGNWFGIFGPAGMSPELVQRVQADLLKVMATPSVRARIFAQGLEAQGASADALGKLLKEDFDRNKGLLASGVLSKN
jgi:tripartite-type tricarboxylate transporter receptor subunit TctC